MWSPYVMKKIKCKNIVFITTILGELCVYALFIIIIRRIIIQNNLWSWINYEYCELF